MVHMLNNIFSIFHSHCAYIMGMKQLYSLSDDFECIPIPEEPHNVVSHNLGLWKNG